MEDFKLLQLHTTGKFLHVNLESLICSKYIMMTSNLFIPSFQFSELKELFVYMLQETYGDELNISKLF